MTAMPTYRPEAPDARRGRWIPWAFVGFFLVVVAANAIMIGIGIVTWPGLETENAYQRGLVYNRALEALEAQAALGWQVGFDFTQDGERQGTLTVTLEDRFGNLLQQADVRAEFVRPTHAGSDFALDLEHEYGGRYTARVELPLAGQWDVYVTATDRGRTFRLHRRIFVQQ